MASVYRKGPAWYVWYKAVDGTWQRKATKARSRGEAMRIAIALEAQAERVRVGVEAPPVEEGLTLADLCRWWLDTRAPESCRSRERSRLGRHIIDRPIGSVPLRALRPTMIVMGRAMRSPVGQRT